MTTTFYKRFEKTWDRYLKRHSTEIILTGIKRNVMTEVPKFTLIGAFSGWDDNDEKKDILGEVGTTAKIKVSDLQQLYSQPGIMKGNGRVIKTFKPSFIFEKVLYQEISLNKSYKLKLNIQGNKFTGTIKIYNEENKLYKKIMVNNSKELIINIVSNGEKLYIDYSESVGDILCDVLIELLDDSVPCPINNLKSEIDFLTAQGRSFKIDSQELSGSGNLMILTLSNLG